MAKAPTTPVEELTLNVENPATGSYRTFITALRGKLAGKAGESVKSHPVMDGPQTGDNNPPPRWIYIVLASGKSPVKPKVAVRSDNAYIAGFTNSNGDWFQLKSDGKGQTKKILPDATVLGFTGDYKSLIGKPIQSLPKLLLGMARTVDATSVLWSYKKKKQTAGENDAAADDDEKEEESAVLTGFAGADDGQEAAEAAAAAANDPDKNLKSALATLAVTLCEAARLSPVHGVVAGGWGSEKGVSVSEKEVRYILKWGQLSEALLGWKSDGYKKDDKWFRFLKDSTGIHSGDEALGVVQLVLNIPPKKEREDGEDDPTTTAGEE